MKQYLIQSGAKVTLDRRRADDTSPFPGLNKESATPVLNEIRRQIVEEQAKLRASGEAKVLLIFQSMDAGGKDGVIRNVFSGLDPHGLRVYSFKAPSAEELEHDYLWRVHQQCPRRGEIAVFNRSHYEDVVAVRVRKLVDDAIWQRRFQHIVAFEKMLADEGTLILKFFLHIDRDEQKKRFNARLNNPSKQWKIATSDIEDRALFGEYMRAYDDAISATSAPHAPWFIVPANSKWCRNLIVAQIVRDALVGLKLSFPDLNHSLAGLTVED